MVGKGGVKKEEEHENQHRAFSLHRRDHVHFLLTLKVTDLRGRALWDARCASYFCSRRTKDGARGVMDVGRKDVDGSAGEDTVVGGRACLFGVVGGSSFQRAWRLVWVPAAVVSEPPSSVDCCDKGGQTMHLISHNWGETSV